MNFAGKLNFYLNAVDMLLKKEDDNSTIEILLCRDILFVTLISWLKNKWNELYHT